MLLESAPVHLHAADLVIILCYIGAVTALGWYLGASQNSVRDYFLGGRRLPWWAITLSIVATETSTVTFISIPGLAFAGNMTFLQLVFGFIAGRIIVVLLLMPHYFRGEVLTVYQLFGERFGRRVKQTSSALFLATRTLSDGLRLFLTSIVLREMTGWSLPVSVAVIGLATIVYTYTGGMRAVIWTDVAQLLIYLAGASAACLILIDRLPGGFAGFVALGLEAGKFRVFDFALDLSNAYTFWAGLFGGAIFTTASHGIDQMMVQRYLCARSLGQARLALLVSGLIILTQFGLFLVIGAGLFAFYSSFPGEGASIAPDRVFPFFIVRELPVGLVGIVIAAVFAASMSTLSSSLNSCASTSLNDLYRPLVRPDAAETHYLRVSRWMTAFWGLAQMIVAVAGSNISQSVVNQVLGIASFTNGPILGVFLLGLPGGKLSDRDAFIGLVAGVGFMSAIQFLAPALFGASLAWPWHALVGASVTFAVGMFAHSLSTPKGAEAA